MIEFHYETDFKLLQEVKLADWISRVIASENCMANQIDYIFCDDTYLLALNQKYLSHDTYTDIITFDYSEARQIRGDIFISVERIKENSENLNVCFEEELLRVMSHGVLHLLGYEDKVDKDKAQMRKKEDEKIKMFHVEH
jgi:rRNA maturation RNase YbeY